MMQIFNYEQKKRALNKTEYKFKPHFFVQMGIFTNLSDSSIENPYLKLKLLKPRVGVSTQQIIDL